MASTKSKKTEDAPVVKQICATCEVYREYKDNPGRGECNLFPKTPKMTSNNDTCDEWQDPKGAKHTGYCIDCKRVRIYKDNPAKGQCLIDPIAPKVVVLKTGTCDNFIPA